MTTDKETKAMQRRAERIRAIEGLYEASEKLVTNDAIRECAEDEFNRAFQVVKLLDGEPEEPDGEITN